MQGVRRGAIRSVPILIRIRIRHGARVCVRTALRLTVPLSTWWRGGIAAPEARGVQLAVLGRGVQRHRHTSARKQARSHTRVIGVCGEDLVTEERRGRGGKVPVEREALVAVLCYCPLGHGETRRQLARCCCCYGRGGAGGAGFCGGSTMEEVSIIHTS